jgi:hypothetical protein
MSTQKLYQYIAGKIQARANCQKVNNQEWYEKHTDDLKKVESDFLPHGSGFDSGCAIDFDNSTSDKIVILASFHHMDGNGFYRGWQDYKVIVTPSLVNGYNLKITGKDYNGFKDYAYDTFAWVLSANVNQDGSGMIVTEN